MRACTPASPHTQLRMKRSDGRIKTELHRSLVRKSGVYENVSSQLPQTDTLLEMQTSPLCILSLLAKQLFWDARQSKLYSSSHTSHSSNRKPLPTSLQAYSGRRDPCIKACMSGRWIHRYHASMCQEDEIHRYHTPVCQEDGIHRYHRPTCQDGTLTFIFQDCSPLTFSQMFYSTKGGTANVWGHTTDTYVGNWYSSVHTWGLFLLFFEINFFIVKFQSPNI